jgi:hypothetical protein
MFVSISYGRYVAVLSTPALCVEEKLKVLSPLITNVFSFFASIYSELMDFLGSYNRSCKRNLMPRLQTCPATMSSKQLPQRNNGSTITTVTEANRYMDRKRLELETDHVSVA